MKYSLGGESMISSKGEDIKDYKSKKSIIKILGNIGFIIFMIIISTLIFITAQSKIIGREPTLFGFRIYIVDSGSMSPTIEVDSMILVKEMKKEEIISDDIITYYGHNKESRVTHRVMEVEDSGRSFITKGDANQINDPLPLDGNKLIGKVVFTIPVIGKVFRSLSTQLGIGILITLSILWIIIPIISSKFKKRTNI